MGLNYEVGPWFNFYKKGNVVEVYETYDKKSFIGDVPDKYLPKNYKSGKVFVIGLINTFDRDISMLMIDDKEKLRLSDYRSSIGPQTLEKYCGEMFVGKYFTN